MSTHVMAQRTADCPSAAALEYAIEFFQQRENDQEGAHVQLPLKAVGLPLPSLLTHPVRFRFSLHETQTEPGNTQEEIAFTWNAGTRWLPNFHGTLRMRRAPQTTTTLLLEGNYTPPLSLFGSLFDRLLGRALAQQTVEALLRQVAERLENEQRHFKATHKAVMPG